MKKLSLIIFLQLALIPVILSHQQSRADEKIIDGCTSITVGKLASVDGSVMTSHTCDSRIDRTWIDMVFKKKYKPGSRRKVPPAAACAAAAKPSSVSWSVSARTSTPARCARATSCAGDSVPSEAVEWLCKS